MSQSFRTQFYLENLKKYYELLKQEETFHYLGKGQNFIFSKFFPLSDKTSKLLILLNSPQEMYELSVENYNDNVSFNEHKTLINNNFEKLISYFNEEDFLSHRNDSYKILCFIVRGLMWQNGKIETIDFESTQSIELYKLSASILDFSNVTYLIKNLTPLADNKQILNIEKNDIFKSIKINSDILSKCSPENLTLFQSFVLKNFDIDVNEFQNALS